MAPLILDTHAAVHELVSAGMPERQAETVVRQQARLLEQNARHQGEHRSFTAGNQNSHRNREGRSHQVDLWPQHRDDEPASRRD